MGNKNNDSRVSQKELLLFSNLTNLEWQFVNLDRDNEDEGKRSTKLRDLLTPKNFVRYDEEIDDYTYPYLKGKQGQNITLTDKERKEGRKEMAKYASVAMGYKEQEAEFLGNWEVVYAGDRYKVIRDFFDGLLKAKYEEEDSKDADNIPEPGDEDHPLSSREEVEENQNKKTQLKLFVNGISVAAKLAPLAIQLSCADEVFNLHKFADGIEDSLSSVDELTDQVTKKFINKQIGAGYKGLLEGSITSWSLFALKHGFDISQKSLKSDIKNINEEKQVEIDTDNMTEEEKQKIKEKKSSKLGFTKKLNLQAGTKEGDGFRVVVFKKDDQIVISYRAEEDSNGETLPPDRDLLQLVYNRVYFNNCEGKKEGQKPEIRFVGLNAGADLGAVSSLLYEQPCSTFYTKNPRIKGYIDLTPDDLNSNYQAHIEREEEDFPLYIQEGMTKDRNKRQLKVCSI